MKLVVEVKRKKWTEREKRKCGIRERRRTRRKAMTNMS